MKKNNLLLGLAVLLSASGHAEDTSVNALPSNEAAKDSCLKIVEKPSREQGKSLIFVYSSKAGEPTISKQVTYDTGTKNLPGTENKFALEIKASIVQQVYQGTKTEKRGTKGGFGDYSVQVPNGAPVYGNTFVRSSISIVENESGNILGSVELTDPASVPSTDTIQLGDRFHLLPAPKAFYVFNSKTKAMLQDKYKEPFPLEKEKKERNAFSFVYLKVKATGQLVLLKLSKSKDAEAIAQCDAAVEAKEKAAAAEKEKKKD